MGKEGGLGAEQLCPLYRSENPAPYSGFHRLLFSKQSAVLSVHSYFCAQESFSVGLRKLYGVPGI